MRNMRNRRKIDIKLPTMKDWFTAKEFAEITNIEVRTVSALLREREDLEIDRKATFKYRVRYRVPESELEVAQ